MPKAKPQEQTPTEELDDNEVITKNGLTRGHLKAHYQKHMKPKEANTIEELDRKKWETPNPDPKDEATYWGNIKLQMVSNIGRGTIHKMSPKDRFAAAKICHDIQESCKQAPAPNVNWQRRKDMKDVLAEAKAVLERRQRDRLTIDVTGKTI